MYIGILFDEIFIFKGLVFVNFKIKFFCYGKSIGYGKYEVVIISFISRVINYFF